MSILWHVIVILSVYLDRNNFYGFAINTTRISSSGAKLNTTYTSGFTTTATCTKQVVPNEWRKESFPYPQVDVASCGRNCKKSWICDPNNVIINSVYMNRIDKRLTRIRRNGHCGCLNCTGIGYKMSVALVNRIKFESWETITSDLKRRRAQEFASFLRAHTWHPVGTCADDIVIFVSRGDRQVQTAVGPRATAALSSGCTEYVYNQVRSDLTSGYFGKAVDEMTNIYENAILTGRCVKSSAHASSNGALAAGIVIAFIFICVIFISGFLCIRRGCFGYCEGMFCLGNNSYHRGFGGGGGGGGGGFSSFGTGDGGGGGGGGF